MKRTLWRLVAIGGAAAVLIVAATIFRNIRLEQGAVALKIGDYAVAFRELEPLAQLGDSHAQYVIGQMYAFGWGVKKSDDDAIRWFRRAALWSEGTTDPAAAAEYYVGQSYAEGTGVPKDKAEGQKWFRRAAEGGYHPGKT